MENEPGTPADPPLSEEGREQARKVAEWLSPEGFDVYATNGATTAELGDTIAPGGSLWVYGPKVRGLDPSLPAPEVRMTVWRINGSGAVPVVSGVAVPRAEVSLAEPGAYRVEVSIVPRHLGPYLRDLGPAYAERELPWIYTGAIYVE